MSKIVLALLVCNLMMTLAPAYYVAGYHSINLEIQNNLFCEFQYVNNIIKGGGTVSSFYTIPPNERGSFVANSIGKGKLNSGQYTPETMRGIITLKNACLSEEEFLTILWVTSIEAGVLNRVGYHLGPETSTSLEFLYYMEAENAIPSVETWKVVALTDSINMRYFMSDQADAKLTLIFSSNSTNAQL